MPAKPKPVQKKKPIVPVRDITPKKDAKGGAIDGESMDKDHKRR